MAEIPERLEWIQWRLLLKGVALGIGLGLILAIQMESLFSGVMIGAVFGFSAALSRSFVTRDQN